MPILCNQRRAVLILLIFLIPIPASAQLHFAETPVFRIVPLEGSVPVSLVVSEIHPVSLPGEPENGLAIYYSGLYGMDTSETDQRATTLVLAGPSGSSTLLTERQRAFDNLYETPWIGSLSFSLSFYDHGQGGRPDAIFRTRSTTISGGGGTSYSYFAFDQSTRSYLPEQALWSPTSGSPAPAHTIFFGSFDGDDDPDIFTSDGFYFANTVFSFDRFESINGQITPTGPVTGDFGGFGSLLDLNGDGLDEFLLRFGDDLLTIYVSDTGTQTLTPVDSFLLDSFVIDLMYLFDTDGDQRRDLVTVDYDFGLYAWRNTGNGTLDDPVRIWSYPADFAAWQQLIDFGDLDGDDLPDLVIMDDSVGLGWVKNMDNAQFGTFRSITDYREIRQVRVADHDKDGRNDILVAANFGNELRYFRNVPKDSLPPTAECNDLTVSLAVGDSIELEAGDLVEASDESGPVNIDLDPPVLYALDAPVIPVTVTATDAAGNTATCTVTVTLNILTSTGEPATGLIRSLIPNPARDRVLLTLDEAPQGGYDLRVYNASGQIALEQKQRSGTQQMLQVGDLPTGVYFLVLRSSSDQQVLGRDRLVVSQVNFEY